MTTEYNRYLQKLKERISGLSKGSKQWWRLNRELLERKSRLSSIPPLRDDQKWITDSKEKANIFATVFDSKAKLPSEEVDCPYFGRPDVDLDEYIPLRTRGIFKILSKLDTTKATGPDCIPAVILRQIAKVIAQPFTVVCRRLLAEGC